MFAKIHHAVVAYMEDDCLVSDTMTDIFEVLGCRTIVACDGEDMLAQLPHAPVPDLIVTDYYMPGSNGVVMIEQIRRTLGIEVPAILLSGWQPTQDMQAHMPGNILLLTKPVSLHVLRTALQTLGVVHDGNRLKY